MTIYSPEWDLSTIPDQEWKSEQGRRRRAKGPTRPNENLQPCSNCGMQLNATQRRKPCIWCGAKPKWGKQQP